MFADLEELQQLERGEPGAAELLRAVQAELAAVEPSTYRPADGDAHSHKVHETAMLEACSEQLLLAGASSGFIAREITGIFQSRAHYASAGGRRPFRARADGLVTLREGSELLVGCLALLLLDVGGCMSGSSGSMSSGAAGRAAADMQAARRCKSDALYHLPDHILPACTLTLQVVETSCCENYHIAYPLEYEAERSYRLANGAVLLMREQHNIVTDTSRFATIAYNSHPTRETDRLPPAAAGALLVHLLGVEFIHGARLICLGVGLWEWHWWRHAHCFAARQGSAGGCMQ